MIEVVGLSKIYAGAAVVDDLSFTVQSGIVTGFLGPNGSGKSTTMRPSASGACSVARPAQCAPSWAC